MNACMCVCVRLWSRLLDEEVVHAAVVVGGGQDVQCIVLPLGGLQTDAADFQAAPSLHLWGQLLVLLTVLDGPGRGCLQIWTVRRRRALCRSRAVDTDIFRITNKEMIKSPRHIFFFLYRVSLQLRSRWPASPLTVSSHRVSSYSRISSFLSSCSITKPHLDIIILTENDICNTRRDF